MGSLMGGIGFGLILAGILFSLPFIMYLGAGMLVASLCSKR